MEIESLGHTSSNQFIQEQSQGGIIGRKVTLQEGTDEVDQNWKDEDLKKVFQFVINKSRLNNLTKCEAENGIVKLYYHGEDYPSEVHRDVPLKLDQPLTINFVSKVKISSDHVGRWDGLKKIFAGIFRALFGSSEKVKKEILVEGKAETEAEKLNDMDNWYSTLDLTDSSKLRGVDWLKQTLHAWNKALTVIEGKKPQLVLNEPLNEPVFEDNEDEPLFEDNPNQLLNKEVKPETVLEFKIDITKHKEFQKYQTDIAKAKTAEQIHNLTTKFYKNVVMKEYMKGLNKQEKQEFVKEVEMQMGMSVPKTIKNEFTIKKTGIFGKDKVKEEVENISFDLSIAYLEGKGGREDTVQYMKDHNKGVRPSRLRSGEKFQGMPVNLRHHKVQVGDKVIHSLRSGAFAVHDKNIPKEDHQDFVVAQALPKVIKGIELIVGDPNKLKIAMEKGGFLYHEQSYMSDMDKSEAEMIKDVRLALKRLGKDLQIQFSKKEAPGLKMGENGKMIYTMAVPEGGKEGTYPVTTIFTTHSVNEKQAFGQLKGKKNELQNEINKEAMERLVSYNGEEIEPIKKHYLGSVSAIDYRGIDLIQEEVEKLGGITGKMCKSGKDRTACGVIGDVANRCELDEDQEKELKRGLFHGASYVITGQNTGKPSSYAMNSFQMGVGEHGYKPGVFFPPRHLCGSVQT